ncbi:MAG: electron transport complex subunit RsxG [Pseudomonadales bacterium]
MLGKAIGKNSIILGLFAVVTTSMIALTYLSTKEQIIAQERAARARALLEIVPIERHNNTMLDDTVMVDSELLGIKESAEAFIARQDGIPVAVIIPATAPDGYSGEIRLIVGINMNGSIAGVRVLTHSETPGLGDKVDLKKSDWILGFNNKSLTKPATDLWSVKKDKGYFDQFTGATITPRAVTKAVHRVLLFFDENQELLIDHASLKQESNNDG